jgi:hypothetical protein
MHTNVCSDMNIFVDFESRWLIILHAAHKLLQSQIWNANVKLKVKDLYRVL